MARFARLHPETALAASTRKFEKRFRHMEKIANTRGQTLETVSRQQLDSLWNEVKRAEGKNCSRNKKKILTSNVEQ